MHAEVFRHREALSALCEQYGVSRLEVFGSGARGTDFEDASSDMDFLVTFKPAFRNDLAVFAELKEGLETVLGRPVDLVEREAVETSRNFLRRRAILRDAQAIYG